MPAIPRQQNVYLVLRSYDRMNRVGSGGGRASSLPESPRASSRAESCTSKTVNPASASARRRLISASPRLALPQHFP